MVYRSPDLERVPPQPGVGVEPRYLCTSCGHVAQRWMFPRAEPPSEHAPSFDKDPPT
jgi:hypothetical protein